MIMKSPLSLLVGWALLAAASSTYAAPALPLGENHPMLEKASSGESPKSGSKIQEKKGTKGKKPE